MVTVKNLTDCRSYNVLCVCIKWKVLTIYEYLCNDLKWKQQCSPNKAYHRSSCPFDMATKMPSNWKLFHEKMLGKLIFRIEHFTRLVSKYCITAITWICHDCLYNLELWGIYAPITLGQSFDSSPLQRFYCSNENN